MVLALAMRLAMPAPSFSARNKPRGRGCPFSIITARWTCSKIPGQSDERDLLICTEEDHGAGASSVIGFDINGKVKTNSVLVQTWTYPFRSVEKQNHCSSVQAEVKKVSLNSIEMSIFRNSFDVGLPIICSRESEGTPSKISNSKKFEAIAVFMRNGDNSATDEKTKKLLSEVEKSR
jgi:hypothetical protein